MKYRYITILKFIITGENFIVNHPISLMHLKCLSIHGFCDEDNAILDYFHLGARVQPLSRCGTRYDRKLDIGSIVSEFTRVRKRAGVLVLVNIM